MTHAKRQTDNAPGLGFAQKQPASPDLQADKDGTRVVVVPEGIPAQNSGDGRILMLVTRIDDRTAPETIRDCINGFEDIETIFNGAGLLANDKSDCYEFWSLLRGVLLGYVAKTVSKTASIEANWRIAA